MSTMVIVCALPLEAPLGVPHAVGLALGDAIAIAMVAVGTGEPAIGDADGEAQGVPAVSVWLVELCAMVSVLAPNATIATTTTAKIHRIRISSSLLLRIVPKVLPVVKENDRANQRPPRCGHDLFAKDV